MLPSEVTASFSQDSGSASNTLASASVNAFDSLLGRRVGSFVESRLG